VEDMTNKLFFLTCEYEKLEKQKTITSFGSRCPFWENRGLNAAKTSKNCQMDFLRFLYQVTFRHFSSKIMNILPKVFLLHIFIVRHGIVIHVEISPLLKKTGQSGLVSLNLSSFQNRR
jgi:hypothetical protein